MVTMARREHLGSQFDDVPPEPGTAPIPEGHVRLFHYTATKNLRSIREHGLSTRFSRGHTYGEPNQIWAAAGVPKEESFHTHNYVEYHADPTNELDIGRNWNPRGDVTAHARHMEAHQAHVTMTGDVPPSRILAVHEPWHTHLRYLHENKDYYAEHPDFLEGDFGDEAVNKAVKIFKKQQGRA
jgi:hypothetical protein